MFGIKVAQQMCLQCSWNRIMLKNMADRYPIDPFVSNEDPVEVDSETATAIEEGIRDAKAGRVVSSDEVRKLIPQWMSKFSTRSAR